MASIRVNPKSVYIKHTVAGIPPGRTSEEIERNMEYYQWKIFVDGEQETLKLIEKVEYVPNDPSFFGKKITRTNWENKFEFSIFGYGSIFITYYIYVSKKLSLPPISGRYYLDISKSDERGMQVTIDY